MRWLFIFNIINNLTSESLISLAKIYCNITFTKDEVDPLLPYLKSIYQDYYLNISKREEYKDKIKQLTNEETYNKLITILKRFNLE